MDVLLGLWRFASPVRHSAPTVQRGRGRSSPLFSSATDQIAAPYASMIVVRRYVQLDPFRGD